MLNNRGILEEFKAYGDNLDKTNMIRETVLLSPAPFINTGEKNGALKITGVALAEGIWHDVLYTADELKKAATLLKGKPLLIEHGESDEFKQDIVGLVQDAKFDETLKCVVFTAIVKDKKAKDYVLNGTLPAVSCGVFVDKVPVNERQSIGFNYLFKELSLVREPACSKASIFYTEELSKKLKQNSKVSEEEEVVDELVNEEEKEEQEYPEVTLKNMSLFVLLEAKSPEEVNELKESGKKIISTYYAYPYGSLIKQDEDKDKDKDKPEYGEPQENKELVENQVKESDKDMKKEETVGISSYFSDPKVNEFLKLLKDKKMLEDVIVYIDSQKEEKNSEEEVKEIKEEAKEVLEETVEKKVLEIYGIDKALWDQLPDKVKTLLLDSITVAKEEEYPAPEVKEEMKEETEEVKDKVETPEEDEDKDDETEMSKEKLSNIPVKTEVTTEVKEESKEEVKEVPVETKPVETKVPTPIPKEEVKEEETVKVDTEPTPAPVTVPVTPVPVKEEKPEPVKEVVKEVPKEEPVKETPKEVVQPEPKVEEKKELTEEEKKSLRDNWVSALYKSIKQKKF